MPEIEYPRTQELVYWINERESIRLRRESGLPAPWTNDPLMANVRYCNVHRENDKITKWIRSSSVYSGAVPVWTVVLARMVNRISSLEYIERHVALGDLTGIKEDLKTLRERGQAIWGNAYTISTCGKSMDKVDYVIDWVVAEVKKTEESVLWRKGMGDTWSCALFFKWLTNHDGLGSFLAGQVVADLKNTKGHPLYTAHDWKTFCVPGPGSLRGLTAYFGHTVTPSTFAQHLRAVERQVMPYVSGYVAPIHMQDLQNCMCEFSKYVRIKHGGKARNNYHAA